MEELEKVISNNLNKKGCCETNLCTRNKIYGYDECNKGGSV